MSYEDVIAVIIREKIENEKEITHLTEVSNLLVEDNSNLSSTIEKLNGKHNDLLEDIKQLQNEIDTLKNKPKQSDINDGTVPTTSSPELADSKEELKKRFLDVSSAYGSSKYFWELIDNHQPDKCLVNGKEYRNAIGFGGDETYAYYSLDGVYDILTFTIGMDDRYATDASITFIGDGNEILFIKLKAYQIPEKYTVDVSGVAQLKIFKSGNNNVIWLLEPVIQLKRI